MFAQLNILGNIHPKCRLTTCYKKGLLLILERLRADKKKYRCRSAFDCAASGNNIVVLNWIKLDNPFFCYSSNAIDGAIENGHVAVLEWAHCNHLLYIWSHANVEKAIRYGHVNVLQWYQSRGYRIETYLVHSYVLAAIGNRLLVLEWLKLNGYECDPDALKEMISWALAHDNADVLKWCELNRSLLENLKRN